MSYEVKKLDIKCPICEHRVNSEPKNLACGESICKSCSSSLMGTVLAEATRYECPVCHVSHELPKSRELPVNKMLYSVLKSTEMSRCDLALQFMTKLDKCLAKAYELEGLFYNEGIDKVQEYCHNLRLDIYLATEKRKELVHQQSEELLMEINELESRSIKNIGVKPPLVASDHSRKRELLNEIKEFDSTWRAYIGSKESKLDEELCKQVIISLADLEKRIDTETLTLTDMIFYDKRPLFVADPKPLPNHLIGIIVNTEPSVSRQRERTAVVTAINTSMVIHLEEDTNLNSQILALATLTNGVLISLSEDKFIRFWSRDLKLMFERKMANNTSSFNVLVPLPNNQFATGSTDKKVNVWTSTLRHLKSMKTLKANTKYICALVCLNATYLSGSDEKEIIIWSMANGEHVNTLIGHAGSVLTLAELPDEKLASGSTDCTIKIWKYLTGQLIRSIEAHPQGVFCLASLSNGRLASGSADCTIKIWDVDTNQLVTTLRGHSGHVNTLAVLTSGDLVSGSNDTSVRVWSMQSYELIKTLSGHKGWVTALALLNDGGLVSGSSDRSIKLWKLSDIFS